MTNEQVYYGWINDNGSFIENDPGFIHYDTARGFFKNGDAESEAYRHGWAKIDFRVGGGTYDFAFWNQKYITSQSKKTLLSLLQKSVGGQGITLARLDTTDERHAKTFAQVKEFIESKDPKQDLRDRFNKTLLSQRMGPR